MFRPLRDLVLLKPVSEQLPEEHKPMLAEVVAVGEGRVLDNGTHLTPSVKTGAKVAIGMYAGMEIKVGSEKYLIAREEDILGVFE